MKKVQLIKIDSGDMLIPDQKCYIDMQYCDMTELARVRNSGELIVSPTIDIENLPVQRVVNNGHEHYIAVKRDVWEYLYLIENPVTAKSQEKRIEILANIKNNLAAQVEKEVRCNREASKQINKLTSASLLKRIKWVFTGVINA